MENAMSLQEHEHADQSGPEEPALDLHKVAQRASVMLALAQEAGQLTLEYFQRADLQVILKEDQSPVTHADKQSESYIRKGITKAFPGDDILGEEEGLTRASTHGRVSPWQWVIDPIDGTVSFASGIPLYGVLLAVRYCGRVVAGVCEMPALGERVYAWIDMPMDLQTGSSASTNAWWEKREAKPHMPLAGGQMVRSPARASTRSKLAGALFSTTGPEYFAKGGLATHWQRVSNLPWQVRGFSDCYGLMLAATGRVDLVYEPKMKPWDSGPFEVIMPLAGGRFASLCGKDTIDAPTCIAGSKELVAQLLAQLRPQK
jgi:histidinol-phosphatase